MATIFAATYFAMKIHSFIDLATAIKPHLRQENGVITGDECGLLIQNWY